jgi:hypothetical protein
MLYTTQPALQQTRVPCTRYGVCIHVNLHAST